MLYVISGVFFRMICERMIVIVPKFEQRSAEVGDVRVV